MNPSRRRFSCALCGLSGLAALAAAAGCAPTRREAFLTPGYRPRDRDETGFWHQMDRAERNLKTSRFVVRDPALTAYLRDIVCRLSGDHCADIRVYVVRTPQFNASMAPNGMLQITTGLLLRCSDEAQLAAIIGHEIGHYLRRHSIEQWRDVRQKTDIGAYLGLSLAAAGAAWAIYPLNLALTASSFAYSRENEREADQIGQTLMRAAGYTPAAAAEVWAQLTAEFEAGTAERAQNLLFATHPAPEERLAALRASAEAENSAVGNRGIERYRSALARMREQLVGDELALRQYGRSERVFDRLLAQAPDDGLLWYAKGEVYRLRAEPDDLQRADLAYARALQGIGAPPETYRSMMLVELKRGDRDRARRALAAYLRSKPDSLDGGALHLLFER